jgi:hypothetical protein
VFNSNKSYIYPYIDIEAKRESDDFLLYMCKSYQYTEMPTHSQATRVRCSKTIVFHCKTLCKTSLVWKIRVRRCPYKEKEEFIFFIMF